MHDPGIVLLFASILRQIDEGQPLLESLMRQVATGELARLTGDDPQGSETRDRMLDFLQEVDGVMATMDM